ncbi:MAG: ABC transporter permease subunit/CPBP intramembrane protease [Pirellulaceae bacterium]
MNWFNVKLIFFREVRDQLRDRRTLFTIAVLPLLLYPLLGMSFVQVSQFMHKRPARIWLAGMEHLPEEPPLADGQAFHPAVCSDEQRDLLLVDTERRVPESWTSEEFRERARELVEGGEYAVVVRFPEGFEESLNRFREVGREENAREEDDGERIVAKMSRLPKPEVIFDAASDKSRMMRGHVRDVLSQWRKLLVRQYLREHDVSPEVTNPFDVVDVDVSVEMTRRAAFWSKVLPFVLFIWALTGAFYPAVDLCAGEKERGTLETLLSSPAARGEIVIGKLLTIMGFSSATALLNLSSMAVTGTAVILLQPGQFPIGAPPPFAFFWLIVALLPVSALFSALALAIAAFARSTKEGQYYLMPLLLIALPLMILPMLPSVEMNLGTTLVPITGMMLLLRALIEGELSQAAVFAPVVLLVTGGCCLLAIRWAVDQFNNESVLFRESERTDIRLWLRQMFRERGATPTVAQALACGTAVLMIRFFASAAAKTPHTWAEFAGMQFITLTVLVAGPVLLMTVFLTRSPRATLLLHRPSAKSLGMAFLLAVALHPPALLVVQGIAQLYPVNEEVASQAAHFKTVISSAPGLWAILGLLALTPAICEELAFRGFILSGLRHVGSKWEAILISSLFFGITHGILQQSISAVMLGMVLGFVAVQTGSLFPAIIFHFTYNSLGLLCSVGPTSVVRGNPWLSWMFEMQGDSVMYRWPLICIGTVLSVLIFNWFRRLPHDATPEEKLNEALSHQSASAVVS